jgi:tetratricopeptide (TPR) repeat protein
MQKRLEHRLGLLGSSTGGLPNRQRTLRDTIAWSVELLDPSARELFSHLAVFRGGFDLDAAEGVANAAIDDVMALIEHSLVRRGGERYTMLETIHEFADEQLTQSGDQDEYAFRHAAYFTNLANGARALTTPVSPTAESAGWRARVRSDDANFTASLEWSAAATGTASGEALMTLVEGLWVPWLSFGRVESGERWAQLALDRNPDADPARRAWLMVIRASFPRFAGDHARAIELYLAALTAARQAGDEGTAASILYALGSCYQLEGNLEAARVSHEGAIRIRRRIGVAGGIAHAVGGLGELELQAGRLDEADRNIGEAIRLLETAGIDNFSRIGMTGTQAETWRRQGRPEAEVRLRQIFELSRERGFYLGVLDAAMGLAGVYAEARPEQAALFIGAINAMLANRQMELSWMDEYRRIVEVVREALAEDRYQATLEWGAAVGLDEVFREVGSAQPTVEGAG